jgi:type II secretory pathway pseudopilin PulG
VVGALTVLAVLGILAGALVVALVAWVRTEENRRGLEESRRRIANIERRLGNRGRDAPGPIGCGRSALYRPRACPP